MKTNIRSLSLVCLVALGLNPVVRAEEAAHEVLNAGSSSTLSGGVNTGAIPNVVAVPALTITPARQGSGNLGNITNDYVGKITITISGLSAGQTVKVEKFIDYNGNGVIDGNDSLQRSFTVTDGVVPTIGGQRNTNVPGDEDAVSGQITVQLDFPGVDSTVNPTVGSFVIKVTNVTGSTVSLTQPFVVAAKTLPQGVTGTITLPGGGPAAGAFVVLVSQNGSPPPGVFTDANGNYTAYCLAGSYTVVPVLPGFVANTGLAGANVTVGAGAGLVNSSQAMVAGTLMISGQVTGANSAGLPAMLVQAAVNDDVNNVFLASLTLTDANGNYSVAITGNHTWQVKVEGQTAVQIGYLKNQNKISTPITTTSATVNISLQPATALIYGTVSNTLSQALLGVSMSAQDSGTYEADGVTIGPDGHYSLGVVGGTQFNAGPDSSSLPNGYTANSSNVTVSAGQALPLNFVLSAATAHLAGTVTYDGTHAIANQMLVVQPYPIVDQGGGSSIYVSTDGSGHFDAGVHGGTWNIALECVSAQQNGYVDEAGPNYNFTIADNATNSTIALMFPQSTTTISGTVTDSSSHPLAGISISANLQLTLNSFFFPGCVVTDVNGHYSLKVLSGNWSMSVNTGTTYNSAYSSINGQSVAAGSTTANFSLSPAVTINISPGSLNNGTQGTAYTATLSASGGTGPYTWNFDTGWLPSGLTLAFTGGSAGQITGTPGESGSFPFKVRATDMNGATATMTYTLTIAPSGSTPGFTAPSFIGGGLIFTNSQPAFSLSTVAGQTYAVDFSTDLKNWIPLNYKTATGISLGFRDKLNYVTNTPHVFYRARIGRLFTAELNFNFYATGGSIPAGGGGASGSVPVSFDSYAERATISADPNSPDASSVFFTGPSGSGLINSVASTQNSTIGNEQSTYESQFAAFPATWPAGTWAINDNNTTNIVLTVLDPQASSRLVIPVPIANVVSGVLQSVTWTYKDANTGATLSQPPAYMTQIQVQIEGGGSRLYNSPELTPSTTAHTLTSSVTWSSVQTIFMSYNDTLGNDYVVSFNVIVP